MNYNTSLTGGVLGKGLNFNGNNIIESLNKINYSNSNSISISIIINTKDSSKEIKKLGLIGTIDDIKIYNRALSDDKILQQAKIAGF